VPLFELLFDCCYFLDGEVLFREHRSRITNGVDDGGRVSPGGTTRERSEDSVARRRYLKSTDLVSEGVHHGECERVSRPMEYAELSGEI
jgi:hypothetical protein